MTGEMSWIKPNGESSNGDTYETHATVAKRLRAALRPFDAYIGPYIATKEGPLFLSMDDNGVGTACLWPDGIPPAYCTPITCSYIPFDDSEAAVLAARATLRKCRAKRRHPNRLP